MRPDLLLSFRRVLHMNRHALAVRLGTYDEMLRRWEMGLTPVPAWATIKLDGLMRQWAVPA